MLPLGTEIKEVPTMYVAAENPTGFPQHFVSWVFNGTWMVFKVLNLVFVC